MEMAGLKVYRITKYSPSGRQYWRRLYPNTAGWPGTLGSLVDHGMTGKDYATLEVAEIDDSLFAEIRLVEAESLWMK